MRLFGPLAVFFALLIGAPAPALAQEQLIDLSAGSARVARAAPGRGLISGSGGSRIDTIRAFLRDRHDEAILRDLVQTREHTSGGVVHVTLGQQLAGLDVYGTYVKAAFSAAGDLVSVVENLPPPAALRPAVVGPRAALAVVLGRHYPGRPIDLQETGSDGNTVLFEQPPHLDEAPRVTRVALPLRGPVLDTGYLVITWDRNNVLRHTLVSGTGRIVGEELRTNSDSYLIFPNSPAISAQQTVTSPADPVASPGGWVATNTTVGNNVDAYLDRDNNNLADVGGRPVASDLNFLFPWSAVDAPTTAANQRAAVTNLFYLNNLIHDSLYRWGFTESAGNFQQSNFGRGGAGGDPLNAEAQDGGGTNNANFATPGDGSRPRMQMYLWTTATPNRDGDLDSDIVWHEYGHGLTWRMIGDMSGPLAGAIGEGMSDTLAIYVNGDDRVAEYSYNNPIGIRSAPYTNHPNTYGLVTGTSVHFDGEVYAAAMWRLRQLWLGEGWSQEHLLRWIVDGMNYTPSRPAYEDMRDGILASMANLDLSPAGAPSGGDASCKVWQAFAERGIGVGANGEEVCIFGIFCLAQVTESFTMPGECSGSPANAAPTVTITAPQDGLSVMAGTEVVFAASATDPEDGDLGAGLTWTSSLQGAIGSGASFSTAALSNGTHLITAEVTDTGGRTGSDSITVVVQTEEPPPPPSESDILLSGTGTKVKGLRTATLLWTGGLILVDIYRDGALIAPNLLNLGQYVDQAGKGKGTATYQVCNATSTTSCSAVITISF